MTEDEVIDRLERLEEKPPRSERDRIFQELNKAACQALRAGIPLPEPLAWFLALALEEPDSDFWKRKRKRAFGKKGTKATPAMARSYEQMKRMSKKELKEKTGHTSARAATAWIYGADEDTVRKASRDFREFTEYSLDRLEREIDPEVLRWDRPGTTGIHMANPPEYHRSSFSMGRTGTFFETGDFAIFDKDNKRIYKSWPVWIPPRSK